MTISDLEKAGITLIDYSYWSDNINTFYNCLINYYPKLKELETWNLLSSDNYKVSNLRLDLIDELEQLYNIDVFEALNNTLTIVSIETANNNTLRVNTIYTNN